MVKPNLKISLVQFDINWENNLQNLDYLSGLLQNHTSDFVLLPEMFNTGFTTSTYENAQTMAGETIEWMKQISTVNQFAIGGSLIIQENNRFYNRFIAVKNNEIIASYNKRHLFSYAGEDKFYTQGTERIIMELDGWRFLLLICYDLRFPVWIRNNNDYDAIITIANWPQSRIKNWDILLQARAIENMAYSIGLNRIGKDGNGMEYNGHSAVFNPIGALLNPVNSNPIILDYELDILLIKEIRTKFQFLEDRDQFNIVGLHKS